MTIQRGILGNSRNHCCHGNVRNNAILFSFNFMYVQCILCIVFFYFNRKYSTVLTTPAHRQHQHRIIQSVSGGMFQTSGECSLR